MIGYITLGTNDLPRAVAFYDALFESIGAGRTMEVENYFVAWSPSPEAPAISVTVPFNQEPATVSNGGMVAMLMESPDKVDAFYNKAIQLGAADEGKPGFRPADAKKGYYGSYFRDLDGNKLNAFCMVE